ncbi:MAG TPA: hypothetical protein VEQ10_03395 [Vicinamibacteria bacterium]|nr:hypothetical protein [Vicinamibacteria bacterium]
MGSSSWETAIQPQSLRPTAPARIQPIAPARYKVQLTVSAAVVDELERLQALLRTSKLEADLVDTIEIALTEALVRREARRFGGTATKSSKGSRRGKQAAATNGKCSRHVPADVRRAVHERDGDRCRYVDEDGQRCTARSRLGFDHRRPFGVGGSDQSMRSPRAASRAGSCSTTSTAFAATFSGVKP